MREKIVSFSESNSVEQSPSVGRKAKKKRLKAELLLILCFLPQ
jgi:hypothetical protein